MKYGIGKTPRLANKMYDLHIQLDEHSFTLLQSLQHGLERHRNDIFKQALWRMGKEYPQIFEEFRKRVGLTDESAESPGSTKIRLGLTDLQASIITKEEEPEAHKETEGWSVLQELMHGDKTNGASNKA